MPRPVTLLIASLAALALPASAQASRFTPLHPGTPGVLEAGGAFAAKAAPLPVVTSISPRHVGIGHVLTIHGRHFVAGKGKNTIVFQSSGHRYVFVRAGRSTPHIIRLMVPAKLASFLSLKKGVSQPTRFKIRVLARRFGASFTSSTRSPLVLPSGNGTQTVANACTPATANSSPNGDADKDGLPNRLETPYNKKTNPHGMNTNPCLADTDGDGMTDFWEYKSALDYNSGASYSDVTPYPVKRPYPNPLDPSDKGIDFDGDGLTNTDEYRIWAKCGPAKKDYQKPLFMSDGTQTSHPLGDAQPVKYADIPNNAPYAGLDLNRDGELTDDERDSDLCDPKGVHGDGLGNWVEAHGPMQPAWWKAILPDEKPYGLSRFAGTDFLDPDTDGDKILDGADDVDHDGYTNADEINRYILSYGEVGRYNLDVDSQMSMYPLANKDPLWVQPFNPCLPDPGPTYRRPVPPAHYDRQDPSSPPWSGACSIHVPPPDKAWPPFDRKYSGTPPADPPSYFGGAVLPLRMHDPHIEPLPSGN